ncbi:MAG TPA: general secretion pathway protein GspB [Azospirillum sp.]
MPTAPAGPAATAAAAGDPPVANGLPPDAPKLAISGGVYSANRAQRMLIVNGQVVNEGADLGGGLVLEEIRPKAAVLRFRGGRYSVGF